MVADWFSVFLKRNKSFSVRFWSCGFMSVSLIDKPIRCFLVFYAIIPTIHPAIMHSSVKSKRIMTQQLSVLKTRTLFPIIFTIRCKGLCPDS